MIINFYVRFRSEYGQKIRLRVSAPENSDLQEATEWPLSYLNEHFWHLELDTDVSILPAEFTYSYIFSDNNSGNEIEFCGHTYLNPGKYKVKQLDVVNEWRDEQFYPHVFSTKPFTTVFNKVKDKVKVTESKNPTHIFKVKAPVLSEGKVVCISGAGKKLKDWSIEQPLLMDHKKQHWVIKLNLAKEDFPLEYKIGVYDTINKQMEFEEGDNRSLPLSPEKKSLTILHHTLLSSKYQWKAAGINMPVSALKTNKSWGVGEFTDLDMLTDFSTQTGIKLIQLLPINDTTATNSNKDSYPYSAVSAFALHPCYLNVQKIAIALDIHFPADMLEKAKLYNEADSLYYEEVCAIKKEAISILYQADKLQYKDDFGWINFFSINRHWLEPYAAYCYLRDKHCTADYNTWGQYATYDEEAIQALIAVDTDHYDEVGIHYYTQYHLHLQLKDAVDYAHKSGVCIKGDLPIGVGRYSADAWMYRSLFHMDMQAGAPPDGFATKGQNWSFPTYNWEQMANNDYAWWRQRMEHMSNYFDAIRIDHVLGFFRIWSIPYHSIEGILGKFVPAWPLNSQDFANAGIDFREDRFCQPYITEQVLYDLFGDNAGLVKDHFLEGDRFKETFNTQRKLHVYLENNAELAYLEAGLFNLHANIIAIPDESLAHNYHLRIGLHGTSSYKDLSHQEQLGLNNLFNDYFFKKQDNLWKEEGIDKLTALKKSTDMLICAEDLGMVPDMVEGVLSDLQMLALEVQRMPKRANEKYSDPMKAAYLSVVTPSTHDMPTIREWWEEEKNSIQEFYNQQLENYGDAPFYAEPWVCREILQQHLNSPAMWAVFLLQDLLSMDDSVRKADPRTERINNPADPDHYWNYRMHISLEELLQQAGFIVTLKNMIASSYR